MNTRYQLLITFICLMIASFSYAAHIDKAQPVMLHLSVPDYRNYSAPPYFWKSRCKVDQVYGLAIDLFARAIRPLGFDFTIDIIPEESYRPPTLKNYLQQRPAHAAMLWIAPSETDIAYVEEPMFSVEEQVFVRKADFNNFKSLDDLTNKVGIIYTLENTIGKFIAKYPQKFNKLSVSNNVDQMINTLLLSQEVDYLIIERAMGRTYLLKNKSMDEIVQASIEFSDYIPMRLSFSKESPLYAHRQEISTFFREQKINGVRELILQKNMLAWMADNHDICSDLY